MNASERKSLAKNLYRFSRNRPCGVIDLWGLQGPYSDPYGRGRGHFRTKGPPVRVPGSEPHDHDNSDPNELFSPDHTVQNAVDWLDFGVTNLLLCISNASSPPQDPPAEPPAPLVGVDPSDVPSPISLPPQPAPLFIPVVDLLGQINVPPPSVTVP